MAFVRRYCLLLLFCLFVAGCGDKTKLQEKLWGEWVGQGGVTLDFSASGLVHMRTSDGATRDGVYVVDFDQDPHHLDIDLRDRKISTIFRFDVEGRLVLQSTTPNAVRPTEFTSGAVYFTRKVAEPSPKRT